MRRRRFTEEQIIGVLREHGAGMKTAARWRRHGIMRCDILHLQGEMRWG
jgi:hypothetical protein